MIQRRWVLQPTAGEPEEIKALSKELGLLYPTTALLYQRGIRTVADAKLFLSGGNDAFYDPFALKDMQAAVTRIRHAVAQQQKITIFGDYDVDGVTAVCVLYLYLKEQGADVNYYIPERLTEGYGMNPDAVRRLIEDGTQLVITVDNGITACDEVDLLAEHGVDVVVTDHHTCRPTLPNAVAVVDPHRPDCNYPFPMLAGVGVVFKLICALEQARVQGSRETDWLRDLCEKYLDLVALGTIADVMPLVEENRLIVRAGLARMERNGRAGIVELLEHCRKEKRGAAKKLTAGYLGFTVAPRINAAGRLASASLGAELFLSEDRETIASLAARLCELNRERQTCESELMEAAQVQIGTVCDLAKDKVLVLAGEGWHPGVIGIAASRISERYGMPAILISIGEDGIGKGSGRSPESMNLVEALAHCEDTLIQFGGHALAAGLTIEAGQIDTFRKKINAYAATQITEEARVRPITVDMELMPLDLTAGLAQELTLLEPFGAANPAPLFVLQQAEVEEVQAIGGGKHSRLRLKKFALSVQAIWFGKSPSDVVFRPGDRVDAVFTLDLNSYQGRESAQLNLRAMYRPAGEQACADEEDVLFAHLTETAKKEPELVPNRTELGGVYLWLRNLAHNEQNTFSLYQLEKECQPRMRRLKLRICLNIFAEAGLLSLSEVRGMTDVAYQFTLQETAEKQDLQQTPTFRMVWNGAH